MLSGLTHFCVPPSPVAQHTGVGWGVGVGRAPLVLGNKVNE